MSTQSLVVCRTDGTSSSDLATLRSVVLRCIGAHERGFGEDSGSAIVLASGSCGVGVDQSGLAQQRHPRCRKPRLSCAEPCGPLRDQSFEPLSLCGNRAAYAQHRLCERTIHRYCWIGSSFGLDEALVSIDRGGQLCQRERTIKKLLASGTPCAEIFHLACDAAAKRPGGRRRAMARADSCPAPCSRTPILRCQRRRSPRPVHRPQSWNLPWARRHPFPRRPNRMAGASRPSPRHCRPSRQVQHLRMERRPAERARLRLRRNPLQAIRRLERRPHRELRLRRSFLPIHRRRAHRRPLRCSRHPPHCRLRHPWACTNIRIRCSDPDPDRPRPTHSWKTCRSRPRTR